MWSCKLSLNVKWKCDAKIVSSFSFDDSNLAVLFYANTSWAKWKMKSRCELCGSRDCNEAWYVQLEVVAANISCLFFVATNPDTSSQLRPSNSTVCVCVFVVAQVCVGFHEMKKKNVFFFFSFGATHEMFHKQRAHSFYSCALYLLVDSFFFLSAFSSLPSVQFFSVHFSGKMSFG